MSHRIPLRRRVTIVLRWPSGIVQTFWSYLWRTTPLHRRELTGRLPEDAPPPLPAGSDRAELQPAGDGVGALFRRRYRTRIREARLEPEELVARIAERPDRAAPTGMATFQKVAGDDGAMQPGDEYVVRMPGPWDGPVRVVEVGPRSFRLATLEDHLEAGQIEFRAFDDQDGLLVFEIESWARSGDRLSDLMYDRLRMSKEVQLHMWTSFLERVVGLSGGRMTGGIDVETRKVAL